MKTINDTEPTKRCAAQHIAPWLVEPVWFMRAIPAVRTGDRSGMFIVDPIRDAEIVRELYRVDNDGIATIALDGLLTKYDSKFGGTSTVRVRRALRVAAADPDVSGIMLHTDSPGGTVAGTEELARDVVAAGKAKPLHAHISDFGASAAYWIASQAGRVTANETALVGSLGTVSVVYDSSGAAKIEGVKVYVISTGEFKGAGEPGTEITDEHLAYWQGLVDDLNGHFMRAVAKGRKISLAAVGKLADGKMFSAARALELKLIDAVQPYDKSLADLGRVVASNRVKSRAAKARVGAVT